MLKRRDLSNQKRREMVILMKWKTPNKVERKIQQKEDGQQKMNKVQKNWMQLRTLKEKLYSNIYSYNGTFITFITFTTFRGSRI